MTWKGYFELDDFQNRCRLLLSNVDEDNDRITTILPMLFKTDAWSTVGPERAAPTWEGRTSEAKAILQAFADLAWSLGVKPREMDDYQRQNEAQRRHLEDMRELTFRANGGATPR